MGASSASAVGTSGFPSEVGTPGLGVDGSASSPFFDDNGIERLAFEVLHHLQRLFERQAFAIRAIGRQRVEEVGDTEHAAEQRDLFALQSFRIAFAVPALVVILHAGQQAHHFLALDVRQDARAVQRVQPHFLEFRIGQLTGFVENRVGDADLADVVQQA